MGAINLEWIKQRRKKLNVSMEDMATAIGLNTAGSYHPYESGKADLKAEHLPKICEKLECSLIDPVALEPRELNRRQSEAFPYTPPFNFTGQPSLSLPLEMSANGLPIGMMFTARFADEATLFRLAAQLEKEAPWKSRKPMVWG